MKSFNGAELAFSCTYFPTKPHRVLELKNDSLSYPLALSEVPETAGCYSFADNGFGLDDRVLFWRSEGTKLHLNEVCASRDIVDASLSINLWPANIISGTSVTLHRGILVFVIPTPSALHRLSIKICDEASQLSNRSVLSCIPRLEHIGRVYDHYAFANGVASSKVAVECNYRGETVCLVANNKSQLAIVRMPNLYTAAPGSSAHEFVLREGNYISRLFGKAADPALAITVASFDSEVYAFSVQSDGKLRCWLASDGAFKSSFVVVDSLRAEAAYDVEDVALKAFTFGDLRLLVVKVQLVQKARFLFLRFADGELDLITKYDLESNAVVDFTCVCASDMCAAQWLTTWAVTRETYRPDANDAVFQPYLMHRCSVNLKGVNGSRWETIDPAMSDSVCDRMLFEEATTETIRQRLFDGDTYSFETVHRAIQTVCKCPINPRGYRDWRSLAQFTDGYLWSGQFKQQYLSEQDLRTCMTSSSIDQKLLTAASDRFWLNVQKCCNQFQEAALVPIAMWNSPSLGLIGTIQQGRFTVYIQSDAQIRSLMAINSKASCQLFQLVHDYVAANYNIDALKKTTLSTIDIDVVSQLVRHFVESRDEEKSRKVTRLETPYLSASFSSALLASALKHRVLDRLTLGKAILILTKLVPKVFERTKQNVDQRFLNVIGSHSPNILATIKHYETLWHTLSSTYLTYEHDDTEEATLTTVAQTFFQSGHITIDSSTPHFADDAIEEEEEEELNDDEAMSRLALNGANTARKAELSRTLARVRFGQFVERALDEAMCALWPDSAAMVLPRFLMESKKFEALKDYCQRNEPFVSRLAAVFRFFQGVALAGTDEPSRAAAIFEDASQGMLSDDEALNNVLCYYTMREPPHEHSMADFYYVVMNVFKMQGQAEFVLRAGLFAIKFAANSNPLLPTIYSVLFSQHVAMEQYVEAIRMLHLNPGKSAQELCLHNFIASLWDIGRTKALVTLHYGALTDQVVEMLEGRCKALHPMNDSGFFETVYAFHMQRYNYEAAARVMYCLSWRLRWESQSADVISRRLRVLSCVCQTVELLPAEHTTTFDLKGQVPTDDEDRDVEMADEEAHLQHVSKEELYNEYLLLEARQALLDCGTYPNGPPINTSDVYIETISHKLYDTAFMLQRHFHLDAPPLINAVALDCIALGDDDTIEAPEWVHVNRRFVDCISSEENVLAGHWKLLMTYVDLSLKHTFADVHVLRAVLVLLLERSLPIPSWLECRYVKANCREFLHHLIEFDELPYAFKVLNGFIKALLARKKVASSQLHSLPLTQTNCLLSLASMSHTEHISLDEAATTTRDLLGKLFRTMRPQATRAY